MRQKRIEFINGLKGGMPIMLGYIPVAFSFGMLCVQAGIPAWAAIAISMTNLTSAGQFAGMTLIGVVAPLTEIGFTTLIINLRYTLMSFALSQKIEKIPLGKKMLLSFGITDEVFSVASTRFGILSSSYLCGLILTPYIGWSLGTILGATVHNLLPASIASCMGIALYAMFLAIIVPAAKKEKSVLFVLILATIVSCIIRYTPFLSSISSGWAIIIVTIIASTFGAFVFEKKEDDTL